MKKTLLAIAIPAIMAAGSVSASFDFYNEGRVRVFTEGDFIVTAFGNNGGMDAYNKDEVNTIQINTAKLGFGAEVAINSCLSAFAYTRFRLEDSGSNASDAGLVGGKNTARNDRALVGFRCSQWGQIEFGRMAMISDDMSISIDHDMHVGRAKDWLGGTESEHAVKYTYGSLGAQGIYFGASYSAPDHTDGPVGYDAAIAYNQGMFELRAYYAGRQNVGIGENIASGNGNAYYAGAWDYNSDYSGKAYKGKIDAWDLEALFHLDALQLGLSYGQTRYKSGATQGTYNATVNYNNEQALLPGGGSPLGLGVVMRGIGWAAQTADVDTISGFVSYQIDKQWTVGAGVNYNKVSIDRHDATYYSSTGVTNNEFDEDFTNAYLFVNYQMHKNVQLFAELGYLTTTSGTYNNKDGSNRDVADNATYAKDGVFYDNQYRNYAVEIGMEVTF